MPVAIGTNRQFRIKRFLPVGSIHNSRKAIAEFQRFGYVSRELEFGFRISDSDQPINIIQRVGVEIIFVNSFERRNNSIDSNAIKAGFLEPRFQLVVTNFLLSNKRGEYQQCFFLSQ